MATNLTPGAPGGRLVIQAYGEGGFRIGGDWIEGPILIAGSTVEMWDVADPNHLVPEELLAAVRAAADTDVLLVGCGQSARAEPAGWRELRPVGAPAVEWMITGSACRTFNVLVLEDRRAAAALLPLPRRD